MKKLILSLGIIFCISDIFFAKEYTNKEEQKLDYIQNLRLELNTYHNNSESVARIEKELDDLTANKADYSEEFFLTIENILVWEKYNYLYEDDIKCPLLEPLITAQYKKIREYINAHKKEKFNKWFYETAADILAQSLQFLPMTKAMSEGLNVKKYYDEALLIDPDFTYSLMNIAQWFYYAPVVSGGGKGKAKDSLIKSVEKAKTLNDKFYSTAMLSQIYFDSGEKEKAKEYLDMAEKLFPGTDHVAKFRLINSYDYSYFYYVTNREKLDKEIYKN